MGRATARSFDRREHRGFRPSLRSASAQPADEERMRRLRNIHPGEVLREEFLHPRKLSQSKLARDTGISRGLISDILAGKRPLTAETSVRLARHFGNSRQFWLRLQADFDREARRTTISSAMRVRKH